MKKKYQWWNDPGHGWLEVPRVELEELGIAHLISNCSYQNGDMVYLEEDQDAGIFIAAVKNGQPGPAWVKENTKNVYRSCRQFPDYRLPGHTYQWDQETLKGKWVKS